MAAGGRMGATEWALLGALSVLWGGSFFFAEVVLRDLDPLTVVLGRVALAAVALNAAVVLSGRRMPRDRRTWGAFLVMGALNNLIPFGLIVWGQTRITGGLASILNATTPLFGIVLAHWLTRDERLTPGRLVGVLFGVAGAVVLVGPAALRGLGGDALGQLAILGASCSYGLGSIWARRFRGLPPPVTAAGQVTSSMLLTLPLALAVDRPWTLDRPGADTLAALLAFGLLSTALAYAIYFRILAAAGATNVLLVTLLVPVSALLLGGLFLDERIEGRALAGMALIFAGLATIDGRVPAAVWRRLGGPGTRPWVVDRGEG